MAMVQLLQNREIEIEELQDIITTLIWQVGVENFHVTETFPKHGTREFIITGLSLNIEDGVAYFLDENYDIINNRMVLTGFMIDDVCIMQHSQTCFELVFSSGNVIINAIEP